MLAIESILNYYQNEEQQKAPEGYCPNCWGHQKYEGEFLEAVKRERIDLKNIGDRRGWILAYVGRKLEGIRLKKNSHGKEECQSCNVQF